VVGNEGYKKNRENVDFEDLVEQILSDYEVNCLTLEKEGVTNGRTAVLTIYPHIDTQELNYNTVDVYGKECDLYIESTSYGIDPLGDFVVYNSSGVSEVESVSVEQGLDRVKEVVGEPEEAGGGEELESTEDVSGGKMMGRVGDDIGRLGNKLIGRYRGVGVRVDRHHGDSPTVVITDGALTSLQIGYESPMKWRVAGQLAGEEVEFILEDMKEVIWKLDERLARLGMLEDFIGIEKDN
jgi:hypothetical protein